MLRTYRMSDLFIMFIPIANAGVDSGFKNFSGFFVITEEFDSQRNIDDGEIDWTIHLVPIVNLQQAIVFTDGIDLPKNNI